MLEIPKVKSLYDSIVNRISDKTLWKITLVIVANGKRINVRNVLSRDILCDFETKVTDEDFIHTQIGRVTFKNYILPYKDNLKAEVTYTLLNRKGLEIAGEKKVTYIYRAFVVNPPNMDLTKKSSRNDNEQLDELAQLLPIHFQLIKAKLAEMRLVDVTGIYKGTDVGSLISTILSYDLGDSKNSSVLSSEKYDGIRGVNIVTPHNNTVYDNIILPAGTRLTTIAKVLQKDKGIYSTGVNRYFKYGWWYVYPLYDPKRYSTTKKRLTIVNIPSDELVSPECSFKVVGDEVFILASGNVEINDSSETVSQDVGNGIRYSRSSKLIDGMNSTSGNKSTSNFEDTQTKFAIEEKPTGLENIRYTKKLLTDNPFDELTEISKGLVSTVKLNWENSNPDYIYPGMPLKLWYEKNGEILEVFGTVLGMRTKQAPTSGKLMDNVYYTNTSLVLVVQKIT